MKLYQEPERPVDAIGLTLFLLKCRLITFRFVGYVRKQLGEDKELTEELERLKEEIKKLKKEKEAVTLALAAAVEQKEVEKTASEIDLALTKKFAAFDADESGKSLLKEYLTEEVFNQLKTLQTPFQGTLLDNIQSGLTHFDSEVGVFASDQHAFQTFDSLFAAVLEDIHDAEGEGEEPVPVTQPDVDWGEDTSVLKDLDPDLTIIKSISITVNRALDEVPFMPSISLEQLKDVEDKVRNVLTAITDEDLKGDCHDFALIDEEKKTNWVEAGIAFPDLDDKFLFAAKTFRFWPSHRNLFVNEKGNTSVWINKHEHLEIQSFEETGNLRSVYERLVKIMKEFGGLQFARDKRWGFLAHNLKNIGSTMNITVKAKLQHLSKPDNADKLETLIEENGLCVKNLDGDVFEIKNGKKFGASEIDMATMFQKGINEIVTVETCLHKESTQESTEPSTEPQ